MAVGPVQVAGIAVFRSAAPFMYANPFNGGILSWIGDASNNWVVISYILAALMLGSAVWLIAGTVAFFESRSKTAIFASLIVLGVIAILAEGNKFDPFDWKHVTAAMLFCAAFFSTCGRVFAKADSEDKKEK